MKPSTNHQKLAEREKYYRAVDALRHQQDRSTIAEGIAQMEAGQSKPLEEARSGIRSHLDFPQAQ